MSVNQKKQQNPYIIPGSIVLAGLFIGAALMFSSGGASLDAANAGSASGGGFGNNNSSTAENLRPVDDSDHIFGNVNASVTIVEYSDLECPFCRRLHPTLSRIVEESDGEVRWVYRHFPLTSIHSRALIASIASECVAELGGNDAFWKFIGKLFESQSSLGESLYVETASSLGIEKVAFTECLNSGRHNERVQVDGQNAIASGGRGTPFNIVVAENGQVFPFSGALPYEQINQIIIQALNN
ncbi:DsbA family protein [Patescibacteria group bacterium]|nr:DsbA family protein [Patescibacteria group bacterium]MCH8888914.1 DsbA family protein [Patescibacteria group bacterium]